MPPTTDTSGQATAVDFAHRIVPLWQAALRSELLGVYLIGSLAHGGFSRRYSDIDMALVTEGEYPRRPSIAFETRRQRCQPIGVLSFPYSGPTGSSVSADALPLIASIISIMRSY